MTRKLLFVDRDGCLIAEPADEQVDRLDKLALLPNVIPALRRCIDAGFELVMVTNQDGLGTDSFPLHAYELPQSFLLELLTSQGIDFREVLVDDSFPHEGKDTRKPGVGLVRHYLRDDSWSRCESAMVGDRDTDMLFAVNLGVRGLQVGGGQGMDWMQIAHTLCDQPRLAEVQRHTRETHIDVRVDLDAASDPQVATGIGYFDHMLEQLGKHGGFALALTCRGDLHIDEHHTVEDCALALGQALRQALGDKRGIGRYGFTLPMDEACASAALDLSGRAYFVFDGAFPRERVGELSTEMVTHFFRSLCEALAANLHLSVRGDNAHHMVEACFKVVARTLRQAIARSGNALPSTKGTL
ncbi:MAG: bifunctional histidinol-phosphatase/imidazoleglycerol-phosphate dehydratase HisB [Xanthomonadales bacterium]|nr:bifunctional histidinol-phosphatase/imidazoleglycerol-phosphate dehydratase HisB [Xanthomonadales bacterium]